MTRPSNIVMSQYAARGVVKPRPINVLLSIDELEHSDLEYDEYLQMTGLTEDEFLEHYGVKGMKWGQRKARRKERRAARKAVRKGVGREMVRDPAQRGETVVAALLGGPVGLLAIREIKTRRLANANLAKGDS